MGESGWLGGRCRTTISRLCRVSFSLPISSRLLPPQPSTPLDCDFMVAQFTNDTQCQLQVKNTSLFPFCDSSPAPYDGTKKACFTMFGGVDQLYVCRNVSWTLCDA
mgnify:CR=1 FL=1